MTNREKMYLAGFGLIILFFVGLTIWSCASPPVPRNTFHPVAVPVKQALDSGCGWVRLPQAGEPIRVYILVFPVTGWDQGSIGRRLQELAEAENGQLPSEFASELERSDDGREYHKLSWIKR